MIKVTAVKEEDGIATNVQLEGPGLDVAAEAVAVMEGVLNGIRKNDEFLGTLVLMSFTRGLLDDDSDKVQDISEDEDLFADVKSYMKKGALN